MKFFVIISLSVLVCAAPAQVNGLWKKIVYQERVFNGSPAARGQFPYQVGLFVVPQFEDSKFCGGSLLSNQWVLTAAHCIHNVRKITAVLGATNISNYLNTPGAVQAEANILEVHPGYDDTMLANDIGLIKLDRSVEYTHNIQPIILPRRGERVAPGELLTVSGWGKVHENEIYGSTVLKYAELETLSHADCKESYSFVSTSVLCCVGRSKQSACEGDSGGPLMKMSAGRRILVGLVSFGGEKGCSSGEPGGFTRVEPYLDWIRSVTNLYL